MYDRLKSKLKTVLYNLTIAIDCRWTSDTFSSWNFIGGHYLLKIWILSRGYKNKNGRSGLQYKINKWWKS